jgi:extracellular factor (EF) 3-hydroxypalmitic acid methyl ester biosynthesis protein
MKALNDILHKFIAFHSGERMLNKKQVCNLMRQFKIEICQLEKDHTREEILSHLTPLRQIVRESPFLQRAQDWPRGYQGDFQTINQILEQRNQAPVDTLGYIIEDYFIQSPICSQHINKVEQQRQLITETLAANNHAKIISIGCGTSEDLKQAIPQIQASRAAITLVDNDEDALAYSRQQLRPVSTHINLIHGNIYKIMRRLTDQYDLVLIGGVFDYLTSKAIVTILSSLRHNLTNNGKLFFTNIDEGNPYRVFMEYMANWCLIERSANYLVDLTIASGWSARDIHVTKDYTQLTHLVEVRKIA